MSVAFKHNISFQLPTQVNDVLQVETLRHPGAVQLLDYWHAVMVRHGSFQIGRDIPRRPIATLLQHLVVQEPVNGGTDMRIRLAGSVVRQRFDGKLDGLLLSQVLGREEFEFKLADSNRVLATGQPGFFASVLRGFALEELRAEVVVLPIVDRDGKSPLLLVGIFYFG